MKTAEVLTATTPMKRTRRSKGRALVEAGMARCYQGARGKRDACLTVSPRPFDTLSSRMLKLLAVAVFCAVALPSTACGDDSMQEPPPATATPSGPGNGEPAPTGSTGPLQGLPQVKLQRVFPN